MPITSRDAQSWQVTLAAVAGNALEWYDFACFGYFADPISQVFFSSSDGASLVKTFVLFGVAFVTRPLGGILLGWIGDKYSRKRSLELSIFFMAGPTFLLGCLPTYNRVGYLAVLLLLLVRLLQGLAVGGQLISSMVFTLESRPRDHWGLYGSVVYSTNCFGVLLGSLVAWIIDKLLTTEEILEWGWRIPFWLGLVLGLPGIYLRYFTLETGLTHESGNPLRETFRRSNLRPLLACYLVSMVYGSAYYVVYIWLADFAAETMPNEYAINAACALLCSCFMMVTIGWLSDFWGWRLVLTVGFCGLAVFAPVLASRIGGTNDILTSFLAQLVLGTFTTLSGGPLIAWLVSSFDPEVRVTSIALGLNLSVATLVAWTPAVCSALFDIFDKNVAGYVVAVPAILSLIGLWLVAPDHGKTGGPARGISGPAGSSKLPARTMQPTLQEPDGNDNGSPMPLLHEPDKVT